MKDGMKEEMSERKNKGMVMSKKGKGSMAKRTGFAKMVAGRRSTK